MEKKINIEVFILAYKKQLKFNLMIIFVGLCIGVVCYLMAPRIYSVEVIAMPSRAALSSSYTGSGGLGEIARFAGIDIDSSKQIKINKALETLKSKNYLSGFVLRHGIDKELFAAEAWDPESDRLIFDKDVYDPESEKWTREVRDGMSSEPSLFEIYEKISSILRISYNKSNSKLTISLDFFSPTFSAKYLNLLVKDLNEEIRSRDIKVSEDNVKYLERQISKSNIAEMKDVFYGLVENEIKISMLAKASNDYIFEIIDPPLTPDRGDFSSPKLPVYIAVSFFSSFIVTLIWVFLVRVLMR